MRWIHRYNHWLEQKWASPTYSGWVLIGLTASFWLAAANTLAGWLYVLSGTCLALLLLAAWLPTRLLKQIVIRRTSLGPVHVGETLSLTITLSRAPSKTSFLLQCQDCLPATFERPPWKTIEWHDSASYRWTDEVTPQQRGLYQWKTLFLKTGAPFGLFSAQRPRHHAASIMIYPEVIALHHCPILDEFAAIQSPLPDRHHSQQLGQDGTTRSLRPYRHGDARRLIHWRSSAKFNELRTRELEMVTGESPVIIALDSGDRWPHEAFESAVIAAASLLHYAQKQRIAVQLWTAGSGMQQQQSTVLETLALVEAGEPEKFITPTQPVLWLTHSVQRTTYLANDSRVLLWDSLDSPSLDQSSIDLRIDPMKDLGDQLQKSIVRHTL